MSDRSPPPPAIIVPAHNEGDYLAPALEALLASGGPDHAQVIVVPNGCTDNTAQIARGFTDRAQARGWRLDVIETQTGDKLNALALADDAAMPGSTRIYLDADVIVSPGLIAAIATALDVPQPRYASGRPHITANSRVSRAYARFWKNVPFVAQDVPGFGVFAMNGPGRARWGRWQPMKSDDTYARLMFAPHERVMVPHSYDWPLTEGFSGLVRVRRRQNRAVADVLNRWPELTRNDHTAPMRKRDVIRVALRDPEAFAVYAAITLAVKTPLFADQSHWARAR